MKAIRWLLPLSLVLMFLSLSIGASSQFSWLKLFQGEEVAYQVFLNHAYLEPWQSFWQRVP